MVEIVRDTQCQNEINNDWNYNIQSFEWYCWSGEVLASYVCLLIRLFIRPWNTMVHGYFARGNKS